MKEYEKMTVKELIDELTSLGVKFNKKSRKAELIELLQAATKDAAPQAEPEAAADTKAEKPKAEKKKKAAAEPAEKEKSAKPKAAAQKKKSGKAVSPDNGYAVIRTGGKQYQVSAGSLLRVEEIDGNVGDSI